MNDNNWFSWEREAAIHLAYLTGEGSTLPLKKYSALSFTPIIIVFKKGIIRILN